MNRSARLWLLVEKPDHLFLLEHEDGARRNRGRVSHPQRLASEAALAKEFARSEHRDHGLSPGLRANGELHAAFLNVHDAVAHIALREDDCATAIGDPFRRDARRIEKGLSIELTADSSIPSPESCHDATRLICSKGDTSGYSGRSCRTTLSREVLILRPPLYSMKPSFLNLFMKKFTRDRVVPIISASISWESLGRTPCGLSSLP